ncbi:MAG: phosphoglucosamine mutase [Pseudomonadota bacterium]
MTRQQFFGTDGVRGRANKGAITPETMTRLALACARYFLKSDHQHRVVIGKDTRLSGYMLEPALTAGFISAGADVVLVGPLPTAAIAMLTRSMRADLGVMISASHNPYQDNGIKLFGPGGMKLHDEDEEEIGAILEKCDFAPAQAEQLGRASRLDDAQGRYIEFVKNCFDSSLRLDGIRIVADCANGAAYKVAPTILYELGAEIIPLATDPNGTNINAECGALHPASMQQAVRIHKADLGIALDGDADRLVVCDRHGQLLSGDQLLGIIAQDWHQRGCLKGPVIGTIMANLALEHFIKGLGVEFRRTPVGDRNVMQAMRASGANLGGENSGHILLSDYGCISDGLIAILQVLAVMLRSGNGIDELAGRLFAPLPQLTRNVPLHTGWRLDAACERAIDDAHKLLADKGRLVVRKSGTEPLLRLMVEGEDHELLHSTLHHLHEQISNAAASGGDLLDLVQP